jgi:ankyrin repeat protein
MRRHVLYLLLITSSTTISTAPSVAARGIASDEAPTTNKIKVESLDATVESSESVPNSAKTGYRGHFSCQGFLGQARELAIAVSDQQPDRVQELVDEGVDVDARSSLPVAHRRTILQTAVVYSWDLKSVEMLIANGADVNLRDGRGDTALLLACQSSANCDARVVSRLLRAGASVDIRNRRGMTALMFAAIYDKSGSVVRELLKTKSDVSLADVNGWTALMHATRRRQENPSIVRSLIGAGVDVKTRHRAGGTALSNASYEGHVETVQLLLDAGAEVNSRDVAGWTPLFCAAINGQQQVVKLLVDAKADIHQVDGLGRTALSVARTHYHEETVSLLSHLGGKK